ncbi:uncharacterized protein N7511_003318 [Penicillium nucicola]|uniref:uncharacterized protein n=1 Tax=Penicillium nucicola TaxID=1850975 RepID=UPI002545B075|nr:uncharacterized protein N7511_003318 [Penicillium nucicola]KAJ5771267.1 hypothetical protein N7511_003318 [Penicillium nucicola]
MESPIQRALGIYEILEQVLLQLNLDEIIRAQQICSRWKNVIQTSPALEQACWYRPLKETHQQDDSPELVELNPAFNRLGVSIQKLTNGPKQETGDFDLKKRIYDKPGSWTTMLATQPPVRCIEMECFSDYSGDQS